MAKWGRSLTTDNAKAKIVKWATKQIIAQLAKKFGALSFGPLGWIAGVILGKGLGWALDEGIFKINDLIVSIDIKRDTKKISKAREEIVKILQSDDKGASLEELDKDIFAAYMHIARPDRLKL